MKITAYTPEQATVAERHYVLGWLETQRGVYEREVACARSPVHREASEACLAVTKDAIVTLRAKWNSEAAGG